ncbi:peptidase inhibitor family I36 protein [Actinokineospora auranticolor]|uniref:Peptidase inhibitor family I36 n=1 Tax=Actinokineospora auranticolor TaxID=155976 RepID=A0A2S6GC02_9PSEU|nr:peptidase inhibitor family I36 protein [Actinokineospora auranticolor]PPK61756.1 peptidase inhibitor family I36 [Actinokineospora auranticolor]
MAKFNPVRYFMIAAAAVGLTIGTATAASASLYICDPGEVCLYEGSYQGGGGAFTTQTALTPYTSYQFLNSSGLYVPGNINDRVGSAYNNGTTGGYDKVELFRDTNYTGGLVARFAPGLWRNNLPTFQDAGVSSHNWAK